MDTNLSIIISSSLVDEPAREIMKTEFNFTIEQVDENFIKCTPPDDSHPSKEVLRTLATRIKNDLIKRANAEKETE
jgi:hypothetical protein